MILAGLKFVNLDEGIEVPRGVLISAVKALGGPDLSSPRATNEQIVAALRAIILPIPNTVAEVDAELVRPFCSMDRRARLMGRRAELARTANRDTRIGNLIVNAPENVSTFISSMTGRAVNCEMLDGRRVFRLFEGEFRELCSGVNRTESGWVPANPELYRQIFR